MLKRSLRLAVVVVLLLALTISGVGCTRSSTPADPGEEIKDPIKIAHVAVLTGAFSSLGDGGNKAMYIWQDMVNERGGILGRPVQVVSYDTGANVGKAAEMMKQAVYNDNAHFIITTDSSGVVLAETPVAKELETITIHSTGSSEEYSNIANRYSFRAGDNSRVQGYAGAKLAAMQTHITKWAGINPDYAWGHDFWAAFSEYLPKLRPDVELVDNIFTPFGLTDYNPYINQLLASGAEGVVTSLWSSDEVTFIKQAKLFDFFDKIDLFIDNSTTNIAVNQALGDEMVEVIGIAYYYFESPGKNEVNEEFLRRWQQRYGAGTIPTSSAGITFTSAQYLEAAINKAQSTDTMAVIEALEGLTIDSVVGTVTMREWDHQSVRTSIPAGRTAPDGRFDFWTWGEYINFDIPVDEIIPETLYKGWRANM